MPRERVVCIGNATVDRTFALAGEVRLGTKNPAVARAVAFGGVARNVAENLARLDVRVALVACVGDDDGGRAILADCRALGIDVAACAISPDLPTPQYVAILDPRNELVLGGSDMRAIEWLDVAAVCAANAAPGLAWTFADCNLDAAVVAALIAAPRAAGHALAVDAVSVAKALRLPADLRGVDAVFCNVAEARAYLAADDPPERLAQALRARGAQTAVMTLGAAGAIVADGDGIVRIASLATTVADSTGAGDALIAGTLYAAMHGAPLRDAVRTGMAAAALAMTAPTPVNPLLTQAALAAARA